MPDEGVASAPSSKLLSSHCPSRVMNTGTASYLSGLSAPMTLVAERMETSCSAERPPKSTAMRSLLGEGVTKPPDDLLLKGSGLDRYAAIGEEAIEDGKRKRDVGLARLVMAGWVVEADRFR